MRPSALPAEKIDECPAVRGNGLHAIDEFAGFQRFREMRELGRAFRKPFPESGHVERHRRFARNVLALLWH